VLRVQSMQVLQCAGLGDLTLQLCAAVVIMRVICAEVPDMHRVSIHELFAGAAGGIPSTLLLPVSYITPVTCSDQMPASPESRGQIQGVPQVVPYTAERSGLFLGRAV